ncbi:NAD(P)-dependent oxidoreductase [Clostridium baratii]|uniref:NAD(P)-dependent oxidoreductase n=1 Tax=Clostridium baratii TaxID=1561 RepID=UPI0030CF46E5
MEDWIGNSKSAFTTIGASNHSLNDRAEHDYYATEPKATEILLQQEKFAQNIWECACGEGHMAEVIKKYGYEVYSTDLVDRGYGIGEKNFLEYKKCEFDNCDIITNPPYKYAKEFVYKALELVDIGHKVAMFVKLTFLETKGRKELFIKYPPKTIYISSSRLHCWKNGDEKASAGSNAIAYIWIVWEKGYKDITTVKWIN